MHAFPAAGLVQLPEPERLMPRQLRCVCAGFSGSLLLHLHLPGIRGRHDASPPQGGHLWLRNGFLLLRGEHLLKLLLKSADVPAGPESRIVLEAQQRGRSAYEGWKPVMSRTAGLRVCCGTGGCGAASRGAFGAPGSCLGGHRRSAAECGVHRGVCEGVPATCSPQTGA